MLRIDLKEIAIRDIVDSYLDAGIDGVTGYGGKLNIRPAYQREFVYSGAQRDAVIDTILKGFSYSCSYNGGNYKLVDKTKNKLNFTCAEALQSFYEDEKYIYYWECMKGSYMVVEYDDGFEETISDALKQGHINIGDLDKFEIVYIKEIKNLQLHNQEHNYQK